MKLSKIRLNDIAKEDVSLVNAAYRLWRETYEPILSEAKQTLSPESFHRAHRMVVIHEDGVPLSFSLSSFFDMRFDGVTNMRYFDPMSAELKEKFKAENPRVMTVEWVTVHPKERERVSKIRQADLIMGSSLRLFRESRADAAMGFSRVDLGADRIGAQFGSVPQETTSLFGIECKVMLVTKAMLKPHRFAVVQRAIDELWVPSPAVVDEQDIAA